MRFSAGSIVASFTISFVAVAQGATIPSLPTTPIPIGGIQKLAKDLGPVAQDIVARDFTVSY